MTSSSADTEDIVQETFLRLWSTKDRYDPKRAKLTTWIHKIAHNLCIDYFRASKFESTENSESARFDESTASGPGNDYEEISRSQMMSRSLSLLPERQRSAIVMCHYQGLSNREAAEVFDVSVDALESLLSRGRSQLKKILKDQLNDTTKAKPLLRGGVK
jgi:RNA polymerase sigma-70 factor (ECF subfamily)